MYPEIIEFTENKPVVAKIARIDEYPYHWHSAVEIIPVLEGKVEFMYYKDGKPLTGWQTIDGVKYSFYSTGALQTGWVKDDSGNTRLVGWWDIGADGNSKRYYFDTNAIMVSGKWLQIDGKWYYFYADGSLAVSTKVDGCEVDEKGVRKTE